MTRINLKYLVRNVFNRIFQYAKYTFGIFGTFLLQLYFSNKPKNMYGLVHAYFFGIVQKYVDNMTNPILRLFMEHGRHISEI